MPKIQEYSKVLPSLKKGEELVYLGYYTKSCK